MHVDKNSRAGRGLLSCQEDKDKGRAWHEVGGASGAHLGCC